MTRVLKFVPSTIFAAGLAASLASCATEKPVAPAATGPKPIEAEISFARFGGIQNWEADGSRGLFVRGRGQDQWYYATLMGHCSGLSFANAIGIEHDARDTFDRHSSIIVDGKTCALTSFVMSEPPPSQKKK
jgi:hypothetical protein